MNRIKQYFIFSLSIFFTQNLIAQTTLKAIGSDTTYELINSVLAPGNNVVEVPDCGHTSFGRHIEEVYDIDLDTDVFKFIAHRDEDDDRCKNFDRQRTEIKTYDRSPEDLKGVLGEDVQYSWKFKLDAGFQPSSKFTHLHQLKSVDGPDDNMPLITLTARDGSIDKLELRYAAAQSQSTITEINLSEILGEWVQVVEDVTYEVKGKAKYRLVITRLSDNVEVMNYENNDLAMWKVDASFIRPKWGIYRSLDDASKLRDEAVYFDEITIHEGGRKVGVSKIEKSDLKIYPNPTSEILNISSIPQEANSYSIVDLNGRKILSNKMGKNIDVSSLEEGTYVLTIYSENGENLGSSNFLKR